MSNINDFISAIANGNLSNASTMFNNLMQDRLNAILDDKRIELAQGMLGIEDNEFSEEENKAEE